MLGYKKVQKGHLIYRHNGTREQHTHFTTKTAAYRFLNLMNKGLLPKSPYFIESAKRVLTEREFKNLKVNVKQKYYNVQKGVRRA